MGSVLIRHIAAPERKRARYGAVRLFAAFACLTTLARNLGALFAGFLAGFFASFFACILTGCFAGFGGRRLVAGGGLLALSPGTRGHCAERSCYEEPDARFLHRCLFRFP